MIYYLMSQNPRPALGAAVRFRSRWPLPDHYVIIGVPLRDGTPTVVHQTWGGVQVGAFEHVRAGRPFEYIWLPNSPEQREAVWERAYSQVGLPYNLFSANCEQFVGWVLTGAPESPQLRKYLGVGILVGLLFGGLWGLGRETA
jgi:hypothetical protein